MDSRWLGVIVLIIILGAGGWYIFSHPVTPVAEQGQAVTDTGGQATTTTTTTTTTTPDLPTVTVNYTDSGFSPSSISVKQGQTVMWVNHSSHGMWVASGVHPTHMLYDGTNKDAHCASSYTGAVPFDECGAGGAGASYSFTFGKVGTWKYHDHTGASMMGTVVVSAAPVTATTTTTVNVNVH